MCYNEASLECIVKGCILEFRVSVIMVVVECV